MALIIVEVLDHHGVVRERLRVERLPVLLGHAYDCDLVIDDPYVSPHHARIDFDDSGQLCLMDMDSRNGLRDRHGRQLPGHLALGRTEIKLHLGETLIRLRHPSLGLREAMPQPRVRHGRWRRWVDLPLLTLAAVGLTMLDALWDKTEPEALSLVSSAAGLLVLLAVWCGLWSLISRLATGHMRFIRHWRIAVYAVLLVYLLDNLLPALDILLGLGSSSLWLHGAAWAGLIIAALVHHLRHSTRLSPRWIFGPVVGITLTAIAVSTTLGMDEQPPGWNTSLSPWRYSLRGNADLDQWLGDVDHLTQKLPPGER